MAWTIRGFVLVLHVLCYPSRLLQLHGWPGACAATLAGSCAHNSGPRQLNVVLSLNVGSLLPRRLSGQDQHASRLRHVDQWRDRLPIESRWLSCYSGEQQLPEVSGCSVHQSGPGLPTCHRSGMALILCFVDCTLQCKEEECVGRMVARRNQRLHWANSAKPLVCLDPSWRPARLI